MWSIGNGIGTSPEQGLNSWLSDGKVCIQMDHLKREQKPGEVKQLAQSHDENQSIHTKHSAEKIKY